MGFDFRGWIRQPSTILGIGSIGGLAADALASYVGGTTTAANAAGVLVFGVVHLALNDNTQAAADAQAFATEIITDAATHTLNVKLPQIMQEGLAFLGDFRKPDPVPVSAAGGGAIAKTLGAIALVSLIGLSACALTPTQTVNLQTDAQALATGVQTAAHIGCPVDGVVVPVADTVIAALVPGSAGAVTVDTALVHPAVLKLCAGLGGGAPVAVPEAAPAAAVPAAAPAAAPAAMIKSP
jgi:hypothetical protein